MNLLKTFDLLWGSNLWPLAPSAGCLSARPPELTWQIDGNQSIYINKHKFYIFYIFFTNVCVKLLNLVKIIPNVILNRKDVSKKRNSINCFIIHLLRICSIFSLIVLTILLFLVLRKRSWSVDDRKPRSDLYYLGKSSYSHLVIDHCTIIIPRDS